MFWARKGQSNRPEKEKAGVNSRDLDALFPKTNCTSRVIKVKENLREGSITPTLESRLIPESPAFAMPVPLGAQPCGRILLIDGKVKKILMEDQATDFRVVGNPELRSDQTGW